MAIGDALKAGEYIGEMQAALRNATWDKEDFIGQNALDYAISLSKKVTKELEGVR